MELHRKYGTDQYEQEKCGKIEFRREEQLNLNLFLRNSVFYQKKILSRDRQSILEGWL